MSIGLPVRNGVHYVSEAIEALLAQDYQDFELIISDNGSDDLTPDICRGYAQQDGRVRYYRSPENRGAAWNYNRVFQLSRGEYFKWASADDLCAPGFIARCVAALDADPSLVLAHTTAARIGADGERFGRHLSFGAALDDRRPHRRFRDFVTTRRTCIPVFGVIRSEVLANTGLIGSFKSADRVLLGELSLHGRFFELKEPLFLRRIHPGQPRAVYRSRYDRWSWYDPTNRRPSRFPAWKVGVEYLRAIRRVPLTTLEQLRCATVLPLWLWRNRSALLRDLVLAAARTAQRVVRPRSATT